MKMILSASAVLLAACSMTASANPDRAAPALSEKDQAGLERALAGRTPGQPQSCVRQLDLGASKTFGGQVIVFDGPGSTKYVNRPAGGCPSLEFGRAIKTRTVSTNLCSGDIAVAFDPVSGIEYAGCPLGEFVPYRRGR